MKANGQVAQAIDTLSFSTNAKVISLSRGFVISSSFDGPSSVMLIDPISGIVQVQDSVEAPIIVQYEYLLNPLPNRVGPLWPILTNATKTPSNLIHTKDGSHLNSDSDVFTSGSIYRQLTVNPLGGNEFTGGLQLQLNGQLTDNMMVSGILSDQDLPIQPEGVTQRLDEIDKVMVSVSHPIGRMDVGDIVYKNHNISRKLIGLKNNFKGSDWKASSVLGGSKGQFHFIEIKGRDGDQGPYQLTGKLGKKDIVVLAGTEKVWLDGRQLTRGLNRDYTVDYSLGEIKFTPKHLIHFDSDILIEFEYANFQYQKGLAGGSVERQFDRSHLILGFYREKDQFNSSQWSTEIVKELKGVDSDLLLTLSAKEDSTGDYILSDGVFIYDPNQLHDTKHYQVTFESSPSGEYLRKISNIGRIYYEFIEKTNNEVENTDFFTPYRKIQTPNEHQFGFIKGEYSFNKHVNIASSLNFSDLNQNALNPSMTNLPGRAHSIAINMDSLQISSALLTLSVLDKNKGIDYHSMGRETSEVQTRLWNLDSVIQRGIRETSVLGELIFPSIGQSKIELSRLVLEHDQKERIHFFQSFNHPKIQQSWIHFYNVQDGQFPFQRLDSRFQYSGYKFSPFIYLLNEEKNNQSQFNQQGGGIAYKSQTKSIETGVSQRQDHTMENNQWETVSNDNIGFIEISQQSNGWHNQLMFRHRLKSLNKTKASTAYSLAQFDIRFNRANHPLNLSVNLNLEESFSELRAVVFDSIGPGLGQYRYDSDFNDYVVDPNGAFISYTVPTGQREQNTNLQGREIVEIDFSRIPGWPNWIVRNQTRFIMKGRSIEWKQMVNPSTTSSLLLSNFQSRFDLIRSGKNRLLSWGEHKHHMSGIDPRGIELTRFQGLGIEWDKTIKKSLMLTTKSRQHHYETESTISSLRNRNVKGFWHDVKLLHNPTQQSNVSAGFLIGKDNGKQQNDTFSASALGVQIQLKHFFGKHASLQMESNWVTTQSGKSIEFLPPEALNGFPIGKSFRTSSRFQYYINRSMSAIIS